MDTLLLNEPFKTTHIYRDIDPQQIHAHSAISHTLTQRQVCDLELILNGGFSPLKTFLNRNDYESVLARSRLADGRLWPMAINLDIDIALAEKLTLGDMLALRDAEGLLLAWLKVTDIWPVDREREAWALFNTNDTHHPGVFYLFNHVKAFYVSGDLQGVALPYHYDFQYLRDTPALMRQRFQQLGWQHIIAFQTRNPMHRAHQELTLRAVEATGANLLIHPSVGMTKPGDIEYFTRVKCYEHVLKTYPPGVALLSLLPLAMRMGGPREAMLHALVRKNYGCTHFIIGRDHAGPGKNKAGKDFYSPYAAQDLAKSHENEMGITIVPFQEMAYSIKQNRYFTVDQFPKEETPTSLSGTELRDRLQKGREVPAWFSYPAVIEELRKVYPLKHQQGLTVFFTGLPCSGKSTLANHFLIKLRELTERKTTLLDGDLVRTHLSKGLGFSQEDRETNIERVGFVAREITKHGGTVICALVAPFEKTRKLVREMISEVGGFVEVFVATPLSVCEARDRKGLYKKARAGAIKNFTGIDDHYEPPASPDLTIDTSKYLPHEGIELLIKHLQSSGYIQS